MPTTLEAPFRAGTPAWVRRHAPEIAFGALLVLGFAIILVETRGFSFYFDDWEFVLDRRGLSAKVLLTPHGPHLSLIPILIYKLLLKLFGGETFLPFRLLAAVDLVVSALALGVVCRRLWGRWWGLLPVALLVTLGSGAWSLLWSFQVGYAIANTAGLLALYALIRPWPRREAIACLLLLISLASASQGIGFLVGAAVLIAVRRRRWSAAWVVVVPAVLYGLWYLKYGSQASETQLSLLGSTLPYVMNSFASTITGLLGLGSPSNDLPPQLDPSFGIPITLLALGGLAWALWRGWRPPAIFWAAVATMVVLWVAASVSNIDATRRPTDSRYLSTSGILLLVAICAALPRPVLRERPVALALVILGLVIVAATNASQFRPMRQQMLATDVASRAEVGALLIMRGLTQPYFIPVPLFSTGLVNNVQADPFFSAYDAFGGITADSPATLEHQSEAVREIVDGELRRGESLGLVFSAVAATPAGSPPVVISGLHAVRGSCAMVAGTPVAVRLSPGMYRLSASHQAAMGAALARFASRYTALLGTVGAGRTATLRIPADHAPQVPWRLELSGDGELCT